MIDYSLVEELGFEREALPGDVYKSQYGRECYYMKFFAVVMTYGSKHTITLNWDCDSRDARVFKNETELIAEFTDAEEFKKFFKMFQE